MIGTRLTNTRNSSTSCPPSNICNTRTQLSNVHDQEPATNETLQQEGIKSSIAEIARDTDRLLINMAKGELDLGDIHVLLSQPIDEGTPKKELRKRVTMKLDVHDEDKDIKDVLNQEEILDNDTNIDTKVHEFTDTYVKSHYLVICIITFIISIFTIFWYTSKKTTTRDILRVYPHHSRLNRGALINRGSNGIIEGKDVHRIEMNIPERHVDVTGIYNH